jgi:hypothetical protein
VIRVKGMIKIRIRSVDEVKKLERERCKLRNREEREREERIKLKSSIEREVELIYMEERRKLIEKMKEVKSEEVSEKTRELIGNRIERYEKEKDGKRVVYYVYSKYYQEIIEDPCLTYDPDIRKKSILYELMDNIGIVVEEAGIYVVVLEVGEVGRIKRVLIKRGEKYKEELERVYGMEVGEGEISVVLSVPWVMGIK